MQGSVDLRGVSPMIASDIMTRKVHTIHPGASAQEAARLLSQEHISGAPVVDANAKVIGIVTEADIISQEVIAVGEETAVSEIAMLFAKHKIKRVPVLHDGKLVGIVSRADIVHAVAQGYLVLRPW